MDKIEYRLVRRRDRSYVMTIPMPIAEAMGVRDGEYVACSFAHGAMITIRIPEESVRKDLPSREACDRAAREAMGRQA